MLESLLILITLLVMVLSLALIVVPAAPVTALEWALLMVYVVISHALTGASVVTLPVGILATALMIIGATSQYWLPLFGMRGEGLSCMGTLAFFAGMFIGSFLIPVPFLGTIIGGVVAVILFEYNRVRQMTAALRSGKSVFKLIVTGMVLEVVFAITIILLFVASVLTASPA